MSPAALFVRRDSHYYALGCDCYDLERNALTFPGGVPVIAHPPCRAWGQLSHFAKPRPGERDLALWAIQQVRRWGGVLEHPINSRLWSEAGCLSWGIRDHFGGVLIPAYQSSWGHRAAKLSGFYIVGVDVPDIPPPRPPKVTVERMGRAERERTPYELAAWLVELARSARHVH